MRYDQLNKTQKRCVDAFIAKRPHLRTANKITRKEVEDVFYEIYDERDTGGPKIGYPAWIVKDRSLGQRAIYPFPGPDSEPLNNVEDTKDAYSSEEDKEFYRELEENGIFV